VALDPAFAGATITSQIILTDPRNLEYLNQMQWNDFCYYRTFPKLFTPSECRGIVDLHQILQSHTSRLSYLGDSHRDSQLYWLDIQQYPWIRERVIDVTQKYNEDTRFEIDLNLRIAQLTAYHPGQFYEWHTDLGAGDTSLRKITVVAELFRSDNLIGGGLEVFNQDVRLQPGDVVVFPSFALHRALPVTSGVRWSLVQWVLGPEPFR
jgi:PKHD-type hydroxylase